MAKILFYLSRFPGWGGIETVTEILGNKFIDLGYEVSVLSHIKQNRPSDLMDKICHYVMPDQGQCDTPNNKAFATELIKERGFDIIIYQDCYAATEHIAVSLSKYGAKLIVCEHSTPVYKKKSFHIKRHHTFFKKIYSLIYYWPKQFQMTKNRHYFLLKNADAYVVLAKGYINELCSVCGKNKSLPYINKIRYINNPIINFGNTVLPRKQNKVLFVGQLKRDKGIFEMLDVWKFLNNYFYDWTFEVVGDGPEMESIQQKVDDEKIARVVLYGYQKPDKYYQEAKIFWMASSYEGWPMTILEAMQRGCVPVSMDTFASIHDIIDDGVNGVITKSNDLLDFKNKTMLLMRDEILREKMSFAAIRKVKIFNVDNICKKWDELFQDLLQ